MDSQRFTIPRGSVNIDEKIAHLERTFKITESQAREVLHSCCYDLDASVKRLWDMHCSADDNKSAPSEGGVSTSAQIDQATGTQLNPIDLTAESGSGDPDPELQQALALSIQQMNNNPQPQSGLSIEEEELSRAVEESLAANQENMSRLGLPKTSVFVDPKNPHERKREGTSPVGLKNIGNTCWFSAVVQSLLHIPVFCEKVFSYSPPPLSNGATQNQPSVTFLLELQKLFALLLHSPRKYIDPNFVIQTFKEVFSKEKSGGQQDVSEFTHKLLEWIEEAFSHTLTATGDSDPNPMVQLFTGHCQREGTNNGESFQNEEDFGALHVQVHDHTHIHDCLGAYTFNPEVNQETWFTRLPPILVLSLSRFKYNQDSGQAEKVHDELRFDLQLCMDRYLETNREESRRRRKQMGEHKERIKELKGRLENYLRYNGKPVSVLEALSLTLQFVQEQGWVGPEVKGDYGENAEKRAKISLRPAPRSVSPEEMNVLDRCLNRWVEELNQEVKELKESISATQTDLDAVYSDPHMNSTPYHLHAVLVHQGQASLGHYWAYVRKSHACLLPSPVSTSDPEQPAPESIRPERDTERPLANTGQYSAEQTGSEPGGQEGLGVDPVSSMENSPRSESQESEGKRLPSLSQQPSSVSSDGMEMEGGATAEGVQSDEDVWLKFNDVSVSEVGWADVQKESYGGSQNTSAYCLIYVNKDLHKQFTKKVVPPAVCADLQRYVDRDADDFRTEIADYDDRTIQAAGHIASGPETPRVNIRPPSPVSEGAPAGQAEAARPEPPEVVAPSHVEKPPEQMQVDSPPLPPVDPQLSENLKTVFETTRSSMANLYSGKHVDNRPASVVTYAIHSGADSDLVKSLVLEIVIQHCSDPGKAHLRILAQKEFLSLLSNQSVRADIEKLRLLYTHYCIVCWNFIQAVKFLKDQKWEGVLTHSLQAYEAHTQICKASSTHFSLKSAHVTLLASLRRRSLQTVSDVAFELFQTDETKQALQVANELLVPCLAWFAGTVAPNDEGVVESVREKWCQCLSISELSSRDQDQLGDLLTRMFEETGKPANFAEPALPATVEHHQLMVELSNAVNYLMNQ